MTPSQPSQVLPSLPAAPTPPPAFGVDPGTKPKAKSQNTTFLGASATANPSQSAGGVGKTLLGQ